MAGEVFSYFIAVDPVVTALPLPPVNSDRIPVVRGTYPAQATYYVSPLAIGGGGPYSYEQPLTGATLTATEGLGAFVCDPAGAIVDLDIIMPPAPFDGQIFEFSTSQDITNFTASAPGGAGVFGAFPFTMAGNSGASWRFVELQTFWYRRY